MDVRAAQNARVRQFDLVDVGVLPHSFACLDRGHRDALADVLTSRDARHAVYLGHFVVADLELPFSSLFSIFFPGARSPARSTIRGRLAGQPPAPPPRETRTRRSRVMPSLAARCGGGGGGQRGPKEAAAQGTDGPAPRRPSAEPAASGLSEGPIALSSARRAAHRFRAHGAAMDARWPTRRRPRCRRWGPRPPSRGPRLVATLIPPPRLTHRRGTARPPEWPGRCVGHGSSRNRRR